MAEADRFGARLATELEDEPGNRFQGMPSDGDSPAGYRAMGREGWIGLHSPEHLGGRAEDPLATVAAEERFGWHWLPLSGYLLSVKTIGNALLGHASEELQERLLPEIAAGRLVFCQGFSEPEAGSDLASLRTRRAATASASWSPATRSGPRARRSRTGSTSPCAPTRTPRAPIAGCRCSWRTCARPGSRCARSRPWAAGVLCEVFLEDVEVPADQLVGDLHGGWRVLMGTLDHERVTSEKVGVVLRVLEDLAAAASTPAERLELSRLRGEAQAARLLGRRAARLLAEGGPAAAASSMAKLSIALLARRTAELGTRLLGPAGLVEGEGRVAALTRATPEARWRAGRPRSSAG